MFLRNYFSSLLLLLTLGAFAQRPANFCGTNEGKVKWLEMYQNDPEAFDAPENGVILYIPLTVHLVGTSNGFGFFPEDRTLEALCTLNEDFADSDIQFFLDGNFRYISNSTYYEHTFQQGANMMQNNNVFGTINCYIVQEAAGACGYANYNLGVVLAKSCNAANDHTWAHEIGHYLSLPHTFVGWEGYDHNYNNPAPTTIDNSWVERADGSNCTFAGDGFCDTPADYLNYRWSCNVNDESTVVQKDPTGAEFVSDGTYFMSYALDNCMDKFSDQQIAAMRANIQNERAYLLNNGQTLISPPTGQVNIKGPIENQVIDPDFWEFDWFPLQNAQYYIVEISRLSNFAAVEFEAVVEGTSLNVSGLTVDKQYYWRIRPYNAYHFNCDYVADVHTFFTEDLINNSVRELEGVENISVFPNPIAKTVNSVNIRLTAKENKEINLNVFNLTGSQILGQEETLFAGENNLSVNLNGLNSGLYFLVMEDDQGGRSFHKIVIE